jgi:uncharacterized membrane protein
MTAAAALGSGVSGGVLFAFSTFVMAALARLPAPQGIAAMQAIHVTVINPLFMLTFFGTGAICLALAVNHFIQRGPSASVLIVAATVIYLVGCLGVTMAFNVPLNDALAAIQAHAPESAVFWAQYLKVWTMWNHVRTAAAIAAAVALTLAFRSGSY